MAGKTPCTSDADPGERRAAPGMLEHWGDRCERSRWEWAGQDSNLRPSRYERAALTIVLPARSPLMLEGRRPGKRAGRPRPWSGGAEPCSRGRSGGDRLAEARGGTGAGRGQVGQEAAHQLVAAAGLDGAAQLGGGL